MLADESLPVYLVSESTKSTDIITLEALDAIVRKELQTNMRDSDAESIIKNLFVWYYPLLR